MSKFRHRSLWSTTIPTMAQVAIVHVISQWETANDLGQLFTDGRRQSFLLNTEHWWANRFVRMAIGPDTPDDLATLFANVAVVTFNYDRVFEFYVHLSVVR